jgi:N-terminal acetyltransferase B complex non-catalytic subunit
MYEEAQKYLDGEVGKIICSASLVCNQMRRDVWRLQGRTLDEGRRAELKISEKWAFSPRYVQCRTNPRDSDRNWLEFLAVLDATFSYFAPGSNPSDEEKSNCSNAMKKAEELFIKVSEEDGNKDRSGLLALLELEKRARDYGVSSGWYLHSFGSFFVWQATRS